MTLPTDAVHGIRPALLAGDTAPITDLHPHPLNARTRSERARQELRDSLRLHGQYRRVVVRRLPDDRLQLLAGHGTTEQAAELGWTHIAVEIHDDLDDATAAKIVAVDNRTSDLAGYDPAREAALLEEIQRLADGNLEGTGYLHDEYLERLDRAAADSNGAGKTNPDAVPAPPAATPISERGQVWLLGPHRLAVGDATDPGTVARALGEGRMADALITDPPYNVSYTGKTAAALTIQGDTAEDAAFRAFLVDLFAAAADHTKPGGPAYVFHADTEGVNFRLAFAEAGWEMKQVLQWVKDRFVLGRQDHHWQHEPILYGWRPGAAHKWYGGRTLTTLLDDETDPATWTKDQLVDTIRQLRAESGTLREKRPAANRDHPTMKPVALLVRLLERSTRKGDTILDVCAGSGAIMIAAHQTSRRVSMVELDPTYADVICRRWEEHTGTTPVLEGTGAATSFLPAEQAS